MFITTDVCPVPTTEAEMEAAVGELTALTQRDLARIGSDLGVRHTLRVRGKLLVADRSVVLDTRAISSCCYYSECDPPCRHSEYLAAWRDSWGGNGTAPRRVIQERVYRVSGLPVPPAGDERCLWAVCAGN